MPRVELPDGNLADFPDTMSTADISAVLRKQFNKDTSFVDKVGTGVHAVGEAVQNTVAGLASFNASALAGISTYLDTFDLDRASQAAKAKGAENVQDIKNITGNLRPTPLGEKMTATASVPFEIAGKAGEMVGKGAQFLYNPNQDINPMKGYGEMGVAADLAFQATLFHTVGEGIKFAKGKVTSTLDKVKLAKAQEALDRQDLNTASSDFADVMNSNPEVKTGFKNVAEAKDFFDNAAKNVPPELNLSVEQKNQNRMDTVMPEVKSPETIARMKADEAIKSAFPSSTPEEQGPKSMEQLTEEHRKDLSELINNNKERDASELWNTLLDKQSNEARSPIQFEQLKNALSAAEAEKQLKPEYVKFWEQALDSKEQDVKSSIQANNLKKELAQMESEGKGETPEYVKVWDSLLGVQEQQKKSAVEYLKLVGDLVETEKANNVQKEVNTNGEEVSTESNADAQGNAQGGKERLLGDSEGKPAEMSADSTVRSPNEQSHPLPQIEEYERLFKENSTEPEVLAQKKEVASRLGVDITDVKAEDIGKVMEEKLRDLKKKAIDEEISKTWDSIKEDLKKPLTDESGAIDPNAKLEGKAFEKVTDLGLLYMKKAGMKFEDWADMFMKDPNVIKYRGLIEPKIKEIYDASRAKLEKGIAEGKIVQKLQTPSIMQHLANQLFTASYQLEKYNGPFKKQLNSISKLIQDSQINKQIDYTERLQRLDGMLKNVRDKRTKEEVFNLLDKYENPSEGAGKYSSTAIKAATDIRGYLNELLGELKKVNVGDRKGKDIRKLEAYITHMVREKSIFEDYGSMVQDIMKGKSDDIFESYSGSGTENTYGYRERNAKPRFGSAEQRAKWGGIQDLEKDPFVILRRYTYSAMRMIHDKPAIEAARGLLKQVPESYMKDYTTQFIQKYLNVADQVDNYNKVLTGKLARIGSRSVLFLNSKVQALHLGRVIYQVYPELGEYYTYKGLTEFVKHAGATEKELVSVGLLPQRSVPYQFKSLGEKFDNLGNMYDIGNTIAKAVAYEGVKAKLLRENPGMPLRELQLKAVKETKRIEGVVDAATRSLALSKAPAQFIRYKYWAQKYMENATAAVQGAIKDPGMASFTKIGRYILGGYIAEQLTEKTGVQLFHFGKQLFNLSVPEVNAVKKIVDASTDENLSNEAKVEEILKIGAGLLLPGGQSIPREIEKRGTFIKRDE